MFQPFFCRRAHRLGANMVQVVLVLAVITIVVLVGMRAMTQNASTDLNSTAAGLSDPSKLVERFQ